MARSVLRVRRVLARSATSCWAAMRSLSSMALRCSACWKTTICWAISTTCCWRRACVFSLPCSATSCCSFSASSASMRAFSSCTSLAMLSITWPASFRCASVEIGPGRALPTLLRLPRIEPTAACAVAVAEEEAVVSTAAASRSVFGTRLPEPVSTLLSFALASLELRSRPGITRDPDDVSFAAVPSISTSPLSVRSAVSSMLFLCLCFDRGASNSVLDPLVADACRDGDRLPALAAASSTTERMMFLFLLLCFFISSTSFACAATSAPIELSARPRLPPSSSTSLSVRLPLLLWDLDLWREEDDSLLDFGLSFSFSSSASSSAVFLLSFFSFRFLPFAFVLRAPLSFPLPRPAPPLLASLPFSLPLPAPLLNTLPLLPTLPLRPPPSSGPAFLCRLGRQAAMAFSAASAKRQCFSANFTAAVSSSTARRH
mmetsp:Transcript_9905/g.40127  ORF Transcript_9905/g.40127 Transcript_9905/m.40127 type:complete len:431 (-) Transcript_9905:1490-2782(-)